MEETIYQSILNSKINKNINFLQFDELEFKSSNLASHLYKFIIRIFNKRNFSNFIKILEVLSPSSY